MAEATLTIDVETSDAERNLRAFQTSAKQSADAVSGAFSALKTVAGAAVAVFAAKQVGDFFGAGIDAAVAQEKALASLSQQLKLTGEFSQKAVDDFAAFADQMEATTTFGDDVVLSQIAVAKSFGVTNEQAQKLVQGAIELSAATGQDLNASVQALGKTFSGVTGKLDEQIPALKGLTKEALAAGGAIDVVLDRFGGSAQAQIETFGGAIIQAKNAFGNLEESFGTIIVSNPAVIAGISGLGKLMGELQRIVEANNEAITSFVTGGMKALALSLSGTVEAIGFLIRGLEGLVGVVQLAFAGLVDTAANVTNAFSAILPDDLVQGVNSFNDAVTQSAVDTSAAFEDFNAAYDGFQKKVDEVSVAVFAADEKVAVSAEKAAARRKVAAASQVADIAEVKKAQEALHKFEIGLVNDSLDGMEKLRTKRAEDLRSIKEFEDKHTVSKQKAADLRLKVEENFNAKVAALREEDIKKAVSKAKDMADRIGAVFEETKTINRDIVVKKITVSKDGEIKIGKALNPIYEKALQSAVSGILGGLNAGGVEGAASAIATAAGGAITALTGKMDGWIGAIVSAIEFGMQDPATHDAKVTSFMEGLPTALDNLNTNMKTLPEIFADKFPALVEQLILGFPDFAKAMVAVAPTIGKGIARGMPGVGRDIAVEFGEGFRFYKDEIARAAVKAREDIVNAGHVFGGLIRNSFSDFVREANKFFSHVADAGRMFGGQISAAWKLAGVQISGAAKQFGLDISNGAKGFVENVGAALDGAVEHWGEVLSDGFKGAVDNFVTYMSEKLPETLGAIKDKIGEFFAPLRDMIADAATNFFNTISQAGQAFIDKVTGGSGSTEEKAKNVLLPGVSQLSGRSLAVSRSGSRSRGAVASVGGGSSDGGSREVVAMLAHLIRATEARPVHVSIDGNVVARAVYSASYRNARLAR